MEAISDALRRGLGPLLPPRALASVIATLPLTAAAPVGTLDLIATQDLLRLITTGVRLFGGAPSPDAVRVLRRTITGGRAAAAHREVIAVRSDADVLVVQARCQALCKEFFGATDCVRLATAASELARNIYMYAREGSLTLDLAEDDRAIRLSLTASDRGPGIANLASILAGTYVSRTGLGRGLAGTRKLLDHMEIESAPGCGTTVRGWKRGEALVSVRVLYGAAVRPCPGFTSCGDATAVVESADSTLYLVIDALGHGPDAERSAREACAALQTLGAATLQEAFLVVDRALADLREAVIGGLQVNRAGTALFAGIGNVEVIGPPECARPVCQVGRVGRGLRALRETPVPIAPGARWMLASDGIRSRALRSSFDSTRSLAPAEAAQRVLELAARETDDASTLILDIEAADGT